MPSKRPALLRCLKALQDGDTLIVWKLDRLGRSLHDLITMVGDLRGRGVKFRSLTESIDTETPTGRAMWQMIGVLAELERSLITERTHAGTQAAKSQSVKFGRKPKLTAQQIGPRPEADRGGQAPRGGGRPVQGEPRHPPGATKKMILFDSSLKVTSDMSDLRQREGQEEMDPVHAETWKRVLDHWNFYARAFVQPIEANGLLVLLC